MAIETNLKLRNMTIYQVYLRNHTIEGTINEFINDLDRIKKLGVDIVYLMPIHSIGQKQKKGELGCPYSIKDYYSINEEYGDLEDFKGLIEEVHKRDMLIMIDIVMNHTSRDSKLIEEHPEFFYKNDKGEFANRVGDWWDITDLDYANKELWKYMIDMLKYWANLGLDGFRADVASIVPLDFWKEARKEISKINSDFIWLAESIHLGFVRYLRDCGFEACSDSQLFEAFDIEYTYDFWDEQAGFFEGELELKDWVRTLEYQQGMYPENYVKLRCLENHDQPRVASYDLNIETLTAFIFFQQGATMIYAGQEYKDDLLPSLFDKDIINFSKGDITNLITRLAKLKKDPLFACGKYHVTCLDDIVVSSFEDSNSKIIGIFNFGETKEIELEVNDGEYINLINDKTFNINCSKVNVEKVIIFKI
ncbi:alpha-amylase family glycosyl hydrolase [Mycoplasmatota bacterium WC44]